MSKTSKRTLSLLILIILLVAFCTVFVLLKSGHSVSNNIAVTTPVADINPNGWDGSDKSGDVKFQLGSSEDHITIQYPTKIYLDKSESLEKAGYYFQIVSGHYGDGDNYRLYVTPHIWGYRHDSATSPMDNIFDNYSYIAHNEISGADVNVKSSGGVNNDTAFGIDSNYGTLLINVYKINSSRGDDCYNTKIMLQGTPKNTVETTFTFNSVSGWHVGEMIKTEQWNKPIIGSGSWKSTGTYTDISSPININITIYDKSELKSALEELARNSGYDTTIYNNANNVLTTRKVTQSQIDTQVTNVRNEIDRLTLKDRLKEKYNDLNSKLTGIGATSSSSGYKAIFDDLSTANSLIQASTLDVTAVNASISALDYYLDIWGTYLENGTNRIIKATFGDYYATFIYPSKISLETNQTLSSCNIQFITDSNYNPTNSDYRIFFDAGGWGRKAAIIDEHFSDYSYTASHAVGGAGGAGNWNFLSYEDNTGNNSNWRFASVTYNSKPYLLVSAGHTSYKSTITLTGGTPTKAGKFTYNHDMESLAEQWTSSTNWGNRYTITYSEPVSIEYEIINAGVAEAKENLQTAKVGLINRLKNAAGRITNLDAITALISEIDNMLDNDTVVANDINALTQTVTNYNVQVDRNWDVNDAYCLEKDIYVNQYVDSDGNKYNYVTVNGVRMTGDSNGIIKLTASADSRDITVIYPDGTSSFTLKLNADHTGYKCEEEATCTICGTTLAAREHIWIKGSKLHDATCKNGEEYQYNCSYDTSHTKTEYEGDIDPNNHDWVQGNKVNDATCIHGTEYNYTCSYDETHIKTDYDGEIDINNHDYTEWTTQTAETCTTNRVEVRSCTRDGCNHSETKTIENTATGHDYESVEWTIETNATCETAGLKYRVCANGCGERETEVIPATGHSFEEDWEVTTPVTCETDGVETRTCHNGCGEHEERVINKLGHNYTEWTIQTAETCTTDRVEVRSCNRDGCNHSETNTIPNTATGHDYESVEWTIEKNATCETAGSKYRVCANGCGERETEIIPATGHSYEEDWEVTTPATCERDGVETRTCHNGCGEHEERVINKLGHNYTEWTIQTAETCTTNRVEVRSCNRDSCNHAETKAIENTATGHNYESVEWTIEKNATCLTDGSKYKLCANGCGERETEVIPATGHSYEEDWEVTTPATCERDGVETRTCHNSGCDEHEVRVINKLGHDYTEWTTQTAETCTTDRVEVRSCNRDGCNHSETKTIENTATGHNYESVEWTIETNATCETAGLKYRVCANGCGERETEIIPATGHSYEEDWEVTTPATCEVDGVETRTCHNSGCNEHEERVINKLGHNYTEWTTQTAETCTTDRVEVRSCNRDGCNHSETNTIPNTATGHNYESVEWTIETNTTCETAGLKYRVCANGCGERETEIIPATGHSYEEDWEVTTPATCEVDGVETRTCHNSGCNEHEERVINKLGHDYTEWTIQTAETCTTDRVEVRSCNRDGCNHSETKTIENTATGHDYESVEWTIETNATCETAGLKYRVCANGCGERETEVIPATGHSYEEDWEVTTPATCERDGVETRTCHNSGCDEHEVRVINKLGHDYILTDVIAVATCTTPTINKYVCKNDPSHTENRSEGELNLDNHNWVKGNKIKDATCGHGEEYQYTCSYNEAHIKTEYEGDINPNNHDYEFVETITPATCVAKAKNKYICKDNPSHIDERVEGELNPNNHDKEEVDRVNANCTEGGHIDYICKDCGEETTENIAPLGHDWDEGVITKQPTKTEKGEKTYTCKVCGQTRIEEIPALGNMDEAEQPVVPKESPNANVGAIVGGAVGGSTGLIILIIVIIVVIKKKKKI